MPGGSINFRRSGFRIAPQFGNRWGSGEGGFDVHGGLSLAPQSGIDGPQVAARGMPLHQIVNGTQNDWIHGGYASERVETVRNANEQFNPGQHLPSQITSNQDRDVDVWTRAMAAVEREHGLPEYTQLDPNGNRMPLSQVSQYPLAPFWSDTQQPYETCNTRATAPPQLTGPERMSFAEVRDLPLRDFVVELMSLRASDLRQNQGRWVCMQHWNGQTSMGRLLITPNGSIGLNGAVFDTAASLLDIKNYDYLSETHPLAVLSRDMPHPVPVDSMHERLCETERRLSGLERHLSTSIPDLLDRLPARNEPRDAQSSQAGRRNEWTSENNATEHPQTDHLLTPGHAEASRIVPIVVSGDARLWGREKHTDGAPATEVRRHNYLTQSQSLHETRLEDSDGTSSMASGSDISLGSTCVKGIEEDDLSQPEQTLDYFISCIEARLRSRDNDIGEEENVDTNECQQDLDHSSSLSRAMRRSIDYDAEMNDNMDAEHEESTLDIPTSQDLGDSIDLDEPRGRSRLQ